MAEENQNQSAKSTSNDEIDLRLLFAGIGKFFSNISNSILWFIIRTKNVSWKYRKLLIIIAIPAVLFGITYRYTAKEYYQSSMIIKNDYTNNSLMTNAINKLNELCEDENYIELARVLNIPEALSEQIKGFDFEQLVPELDLIEDELKEALLENRDEDFNKVERILNRYINEYQTTYRIFVYTFDYQLVTQLEEPIVNYFKKTNYVQKRLDIDRQNLELRLAKIDDNLKELDSLRILVVKYFATLSDRKREGSNNVILAEDNAANPILIFEEHEKMYNRKLDVRKQLYLEANFEVIDGFTIFRNPINPGYAKTGFYVALLSVALFYFIVLLMEINIYLNNFEKRHKKQEGVAV